MNTAPMTLSGLRDRADRKGVKILKSGDTYTLVDKNNDIAIGTPVTGLIQLEEAIDWVDPL